MVLRNLIPIVLIAALIALGLWKAEKAMIRGFALFGKGVVAVITVGLVSIIVEALTGFVLIKDLAPIEEGFMTVGNIAIVLAGAFPLVYTLTRLFRKPLLTLGKALGVNDVAAAGLVATLANSIATFGLVKDMDNRGKVVNMAFAAGGTVSFTMSACNKGGRKTNIMGTKGEMFLDFEGDEIKIYHFDTRQFEILRTRTGAVSGHGGGDDGIVRALYDYFIGVKTADQVSEIGISCRNHLLVFAAEAARHQNAVVDTEEFRKSIS
jgi:hypothetical protein